MNDAHKMKVDLNRQYKYGNQLRKKTILHQVVNATIILELPENLIVADDNIKGYKIKTKKLRLYQNVDEPIELSRLAFDVLLAVIARMAKSSVKTRDAIDEIRATSFTAQSITPTLDSMEIVEIKDKTNNPISSIDREDV